MIEEIFYRLDHFLFAWLTYLRIGADSFAFFEIVVGNAECPDKHPGAMPDVKGLKIKLIFSKQSGVLIGGQVAGGISAGEIVNIIGLGLQKTVSMTELETLQVATHPKLTPAPTMYPLITAAQDALKKCRIGK